MNNSQNNIKALYIHIPFCSSVCSYCDFYKMRAKPETISKYIDYLIKEMAFWKDYYAQIETIYIGGGTPSILSAFLLEKLFNALQTHLDLTKIKEFTFEANPNDISNELIILLKRYHINRLSLGIQSFNNAKLKVLGRTHQQADAVKALEICQQNDFNNVNVDLIFGLPYENWRILKNDFHLAIKHGAKHISLYSLILEDKTFLSYLHKQNKFEEMDEVKQAFLYEKAQAFMNDHSFVQYEISNFSLNGYQSLHNLTYWNNDEYLGLGASASYYVNGVRYTNIKNLESYFQGIDQKKPVFDEVTPLSRLDQMREHLMLGLRKTLGVNTISFKKRYQDDILTIFPVINDLITKKMLILQNDQLFIPKDKLFVSNEVLVQFF
ncbi:MAG: radical SAM family heme chaperone HemW [Bacilli bacterium]